MSPWSTWSTRDQAATGRAGDIDALELQHSSREAAGEYNWFGFRDPGRLRQRVENGETLRPERGQLAVVDDDGNVVGEVAWIKAINGPPPNGECWNLGIWIVSGPPWQGVRQRGATARRGVPVRAHL